MKELAVVHSKQKPDMGRIHASTIRGGWKQAGVTLIELLVTVLVIGILAAIAYPSYRDQVARGNRAEAQGILLENAQLLERNYTIANRYDTLNADGTGGAPTIIAQSPKTGTAKYTIAAAYGTAPAQTYTLTATRTGSMASDACGNLTLDNTGVKGSSLGSPTDCWKQ